jgi:anthranilate synthase component 1
MIAPDLKILRATIGDSDVITLVQRLMSDQLTPVMAYRRLVSADERTAPSFLLESVVNGATVGRYSFLGAQPAVEVYAREGDVTVTDSRAGASRSFSHENPLEVMREIACQSRPAAPLAGDAALGAWVGWGGWVGYAGYDTARYLEPEKLGFDRAPHNDRDLPDLHFGLYRELVAFDHVDKIVYAICHVPRDQHESVDAAYHAGADRLQALVQRLKAQDVPLPAGPIDLDLAAPPDTAMDANFTRDGFEKAVGRCKNYIAEGDAFQIVLSQRFERRTTADPFEIYRALRVVNPSPYMIYLQARGSILVASSPEILCRTQGDLVVSRPLAGTRRRGATPAEDEALEAQLRASEKDRAEHVMLVDLARNDLGRVCKLASIDLERVLDVERYSHVMHLSSTVTGRLRNGLDAWDALKATLPVGTVSGAPKLRAMQIIDELEPTRRGPYAGGIGVVGHSGDTDVALALRTMVIPTDLYDGTSWTVHLQAGAGIVADSDPAAEYDETVNKAAALGRAIDLAEHAFGC